MHCIFILQKWAATCSLCEPGHPALGTEARATCPRRACVGERGWRHGDRRASDRARHTAPRRPEPTHMSRIAWDRADLEHAVLFSEHVSGHMSTFVLRKYGPHCFNKNAGPIMGSAPLPTPRWRARANAPCSLGRGGAGGGAGVCRTGTDGGWRRPQRHALAKPGAQTALSSAPFPGVCFT